MAKIYIVNAAPDWFADTPVFVTRNKELAISVAEGIWHGTVFELDPEVWHSTDADTCIFYNADNEED